MGYRAKNQGARDRRAAVSLLTIMVSLAGLLLITAPAGAQYDGLPTGNWRQYCTNARMDGNELKAHCRRANGALVYVEANISSCRGVVSYDVGQTKFLCGYQGGPSYGGGPGYGNGQGYGADGLPAGNWRQYCTNARMEGSELKAHCRRANGTLEYVEANIGSCGGVVSYDIGRTKFICGGSGGFGGQNNTYGGGNSNFPPGSWNQSCTNASMQGSLLRAQCRNSVGQLVYSQIDANQCYRGIWNSNGQLRCQ